MSKKEDSKPRSSSISSEEEESMAGDDDFHDYSEEEISSLWREKAVLMDELHVIRKKRHFFLQLIFWQNNRITWEAYDSKFGNRFPRLDEPNLRIDELNMPKITFFRQWVLNERWEWIESTQDAIKEMNKSSGSTLHRGGIISVYQSKKENFERKPLIA